MKAIQFLSEVRAELKKVDWPTKPDVVKMTILVILISVIVGLYIGALDVGLAKLIESIITN